MLLEHFSNRGGEESVLARWLGSDGGHGGRDGSGARADGDGEDSRAQDLLERGGGGDDRVAPSEFIGLRGAVRENHYHRGHRLPRRDEQHVARLVEGSREVGVADGARADAEDGGVHVHRREAQRAGHTRSAVEGHNTHASAS